MARDDSPAIENSRDKLFNNEKLVHLVIMIVNSNDFIEEYYIYYLYYYY